MEIKIGDGYKKGGSCWRVIDTTADVITIKNGKGEERTLYPSELQNYTPLKMKCCSECKKNFPEDLIAPLFSIEDGKQKTIKVCSICALEMINNIHGLKRKNFRQGSLAQRKLQETRDFIK